MLTRISEWAECSPVIRKRIGNTDVSARGSFAFGDIVEFTAEAPRKLGASAVVLRICKDGEPDTDMPFIFDSTDGTTDLYRLDVDTATLCGDDSDGIFFYEFLFLRGLDTLFTRTYNNVDFEMSSRSEGRFTMLIHRKEMSAPEWFPGRTMYQIFVDRFAIGEGNVGTREDIVINPDWEGGIPQYAEIAGGDVKNNMFFGGNLWGVAEKIDYLKSMGVGIIYLNPIFRAYSNHKYDTADYYEIDSMFGGREAFEHLLRKAEAADIKIILDGVFNHTGDNSRYFDKYGEYGGKGAYCDEASPYRDWYCFGNDKDKYESWWGIKILPRLNHENESCRHFFTSDDGVGAHYIKEGVAGWRLDVADELSDKFLDEFTASVKKASGSQAIIIGEVWENAAEKIAYGKRRRYLRGTQLDSVMNYPFRNGVLKFVIEKDVKFFADILKSIYSTYPKAVSDCLMNIVGTHDTERVLTVLGKQSVDTTDGSGSELATKRFSKQEREAAIKKLMLTASVQYTVYGVPSVYYGDEAGVEGYRDPFCRLPYPWGREEAALLEHYRRLGEIRRENSDVLADGEFFVECADRGVLCYRRRSENGEICVIANAENKAIKYTLEGRWRDLLSQKIYSGKIASTDAVILRKV